MCVMIPNMKLLFRGIIPSIGSHLLNNTLDSLVLVLSIEHTSDDIHVFLFIGTSYELPCINNNRRIEPTERNGLLLNSRIPILEVLSCPAFSESIILAKVAADSNGDIVVMLPPYYFAFYLAKLSKYLQCILEQMQMPLFIYNTLVNNKVVLESQSLKKAANATDINRHKDCSPNLTYFKQMKFHHRIHPDFSLMIIPEEFMAVFVFKGRNGIGNEGINRRSKF